MKRSIAIWSLALGIIGFVAGANAQETRDTKKADNNQNNAQRNNAQGNQNNAQGNQNNAQRNQNPQAGQAGQAGARQGQGQAGGAGRLDDFVASCLILENQNEVAAAKLAQQHAKSSDVKSFAQQMEKDHSQLISELEKYAQNDFKNRRLEGRGSESAGAGDTGRGDQAGGASRASGKADPARGGEARPAAGTAAGANQGQAGQGQVGQAGQAGQGQAGQAGQAGQGQLGQGQGSEVLHTQLQIKHEIADQCLSSTSKELSSKKGEDFDQCYIGLQIAMHMKMIDELKVLERHVSQQLQGTLRDGREHAEHHLEQAKKIMDSLASNSGGNKNRDSKSSDK